MLSGEECSHVAEVAVDYTTGTRHMRVPPVLRSEQQGVAGPRTVPESDAPAHTHMRPAAPVNEHGRRAQDRPAAGEAWCPRIVSSAQATKKGWV